MARHEPRGREPARGAGRRLVGRRRLVLRGQPRNRPRADGAGQSAPHPAPAGPLEGGGGGGRGQGVEAFAGTGPAARRSREQQVRRVRHQVRGKLLLRARGAAPAAGDRVVVVPQGCDQVHLSRMKWPSPSPKRALNVTDYVGGDLGERRLAQRFPAVAGTEEVTWVALELP